MYLTNESQFFLLPPSGIEKSMDMPQQLTASYGGSDYFVNSWLKADETGIEMSLFSDFGTNLAELTYREGEISFSSLVLPKSLKPEYIVADLQLCFYKPALLGPALQQCGLVLETPGNKRRILKGNDLIIEIEKSQTTVKLVNHLRGYTYTVEGEF